jgi:hypothetical protein
MNSFIEILHHWAAPTGLTVVGEAPLAADGLRAAEGALALAEMAGADEAGAVQSISVKNGRVAVIAHVTDPVAIAKVKARVYRGFALISLGGRVERAALVDSPSMALAKAGGARPAFLKIGRGVMEMLKNSWQAAYLDLANKKRKLLAARPRNPKEQWDAAATARKIDNAMGELLKQAPLTVVETFRTTEFTPSGRVLTQNQTQGMHTTAGGGGRGRDLGPAGGGGSAAPSTAPSFTPPPREYAHGNSTVNTAAGGMTKSFVEAMRLAWATAKRDDEYLRSRAEKATEYQIR